MVSTVENGPKNEEGFSGQKEQVVLKVTRSVTTLMTHMFVGIVVGVNLLFTFRNGLPLNATNLHVILCVVGFQLMMGESILALAPDSWMSTLKLRHKRLVHWVMQVGGSVLALVGCFIKIVDKNVHWNSLHGQFALVAMVFTVASLLNGVTSLYANELRRIIPGILSKLTHICFGIVAFAAASISLIYGMDKGSFRNWATHGFTDTAIAMTVIFTFVIIINPFITFFNKFRVAIGK